MIIKKYILPDLVFFNGFLEESILNKKNADLNIITENLL